MAKLNDRADLQTQLFELKYLLNETVIGQEAAIEAILGALERYQAGLHDGKRPIGSFLFLGPTGVGKTWLVEKLAEFTQPPDAFIRIDCSEFSLDHEVAKLFGSPPGYVGSDQSSMFVKQIENISHPEGGFILLLDEIEKAHSRFFDAWLSVMDSGIMTDSKGRRLDFSKALIFLTSNVGASNYSDRKDLGFRPERPSESSIRAQVQTEVKKTFRPEFINRLTGQVHFDPLTLEQQEKIFERLIADLNSRLTRHLVRIELGEKLQTKLFREGFSREYGAREIKRTLIRHLESPIAKRLISQDIKEDSLIRVDLDEHDAFTLVRLGDYPVLAAEEFYHVG
jgi:ATP-dependent Clp protease ATP-binding subunit ClpA